MKELVLLRRLSRRKLVLGGTAALAGLGLAAACRGEQKRSPPQQRPTGVPGATATTGGRAPTIVWTNEISRGFLIKPEDPRPSFFLADTALVAHDRGGLPTEFGLEDGAMKWQWQYPAQVFAFDGKTVYLIRRQDNRVYAVAVGGDVKWKWQLEPNLLPNELPALAGGRVYLSIGDVRTYTASIVALDGESGARLFETPIGGAETLGAIVGAAVFVQGNSSFFIDAVTGQEQLRLGRTIDFQTKDRTAVLEEFEEEVDVIGLAIDAGSPEVIWKQPSLAGSKIMGDLVTAEDAGFRSDGGAALDLSTGSRIYEWRVSTLGCRFPHLAELFTSSTNRDRRSQRLVPEPDRQNGRMMR